jgi:hypothetical protein
VILTNNITRIIFITMDKSSYFMAFSGTRCVAWGPLAEVITRTKEQLGEDEQTLPLFFSDESGEQVDFDLRGTSDEAVARLSEHPLFAAQPEAKRSGPGRPKLGVVSREVSLLPRHWEWLEAQRGSVSVVLRALVEEASKRHGTAHVAYKARAAAGKFMWTIAGNLPDFEEASRALYAKDDARLHELVEAWPPDVRHHVLRLVDLASRGESSVTVGVGL